MTSDTSDDDACDPGLYVGRPEPRVLFKTSDMVDELKSLRAENETLRAALREIASDELRWGDRYTADQHIETARRALGMETE